MSSKKYFFIVLSVFFSCNLSNETSHMSGNSLFMNKGIGYRMIYSNNAILHKTTIYQDVISKVYNADFILAKQRPNKKHYVPSLGIDLYTRYRSYLHYKENPDIINKAGYKEQKGKIEWDSVNYKLFFERGASDKNTTEDIQISWTIADSLIDNDPYYKKIFANEVNYWIICNLEDTLIGPLTKREYIAKRKDLKIPDDLQLDLE
ncbi:MAG: hypothetical protein EOP48_24090 [Sphingobacteriales bacterium]|nr:MAG: hypothetical protein EOP48_24090 [Sphingobacteriales bacterium]